MYFGNVFRSASQQEMSAPKDLALAQLISAANQIANQKNLGKQKFSRYQTLTPAQLKGAIDWQ